MIKREFKKEFTFEDLKMGRTYGAVEELVENNKVRYIGTVTFKQHLHSLNWTKENIKGVIEDLEFMVKTGYGVEIFLLRNRLELGKYHEFVKFVENNIEELKRNTTSEGINEVMAINQESENMLSNFGLFDAAYERFIGHGLFNIILNDIDILSMHEDLLDLFLLSVNLFELDNEELMITLISRADSSDIKRAYIGLTETQKENLPESIKLLVSTSGNIDTRPVGVILNEMSTKELIIAVDQLNTHATRNKKADRVSLKIKREYIEHEKRIKKLRKELSDSLTEKEKAKICGNI